MLAKVHDAFLIDVAFMSLTNKNCFEYLICLGRLVCDVLE
jgi:hypothetical protein